MRQAVAVVVIVCLLVMLCPPPQAEAQYAVIDVAAIAQLMESLAVLMEIVGLNVKDLAAMATMGPILELIRQVGVLAAQVQNEARIIRQIAAGWGILLDPVNLPCTAIEARSWNYRASEFSRMSISQIILLRGLIDQTIEILATLAQVLTLIAIITGTTSGAQLSAALLARTSVVLDALRTKTDGFQTIMLGGQAIEHMNVLIGDCLAQKRFADWGTR